MPKQRLHILHLEDNKNDAELVSRTLKSGGFECDIALAESEKDFREALTSSAFDLVISDYTLPSFDGLTALRLVRAKCPDMPFIFLTGTMTEDSAIDSLVNGATDYVVKGRISRLIPAMERAIREAEERRDRALAEDQARKAESLYRIITENTGDMVAVLDLDGKRIYSSPSYRSLVGTGRELRGTNSFNEVHPDDREKIKQTFRETVESGKGRRSEYRFLMSDGSIRYIESQGNVVLDSAGKPINVVVVSRDVTERKEIENALRLSESRFRELVEQAADVIFTADENWKVLSANTRTCELLGYTLDELTNQDLRSFIDGQSIERDLPRVKALRKGESLQFELRLKHKNGALIAGEISLKKLLDGTYQGIVRDTTARLKSEEQIRFQASVLDQVRNGVVSTNLEGKITFWNKCAEEMFGWTAAEALGRDPATFLFQENGHPARTQKETDPAQPGQREEEIICLRRDGKRIPVYNRSTRLLDRQGHPSGRVDVLVDITTLKQAEAEIIRARDFYLSLFEDFPALIWRTDAQGNTNYLNRTWLAFTGKKLEQETGLGWIQGLHPEDAERCRVIFQESLAKRKPFESEGRLMHYTGEYHWIVNIGRPFHNLDGSFGGYIGTCLDVTDRKNAEDQLSFLSQAVQQSPASIVLTDTTGNIQYVNPRFTALTGYTLKESLGQNPRFLKSGKTTPEEYKRLWETVSAGGQWRGEFQNKKKDGTLYWESASISPVMSNGVITHFLAVKEDISERKVMEDQVRQMQKLESIGTLAGGIAHDFNNILSIIMGHLSLIELKKGEPESLATGIEVMNKAVQRGAGLVRQILTFARKNDIVLEPVSVNQAARDIAAMLEETFPKTIEVQLFLEKSIPVVSSDRTQIHQAILNLCVNARDAMMETPDGGRPPGGTLRIRTSVVDGNVLRRHHADASAGAYVCISVSDTGVGMDDKTKARMFEPFYTTKEAGKGTGLGLAVVYGVLRSHNGLIEVDSTAGLGTTIRLFLPVPEGIMTPAPDGKANNVASLAGTETILFVEDEIAISALMETLLTDRGYTVLTAADGQEALTTFKAHRTEIALVLSDLGLPRLDGIALFAKIQAINPKVPVILASGYIEPEVKAELLRTGAKAIIAKPYEPLEILRMLRCVLDSPEDRRPAT